MSDIGVAEIPVDEDERPLPPPEAPERHALVEGPILRTLLHLAWPNALAFSAGTCVVIAETSYIGRLGVESLAAMALVFPFVMLTMTMSGGAMGGGVASAIARALGAGDHDRASTLATHAMLNAIGFGLVVMLVMLIFGPFLLEAMGGRGNVLAQAISYVQIFFGGAVLPWLLNSFAGILLGTGNMKLPSAMFLNAAACQIVLGGSLGLGLGPIPQFGMRGLADRLHDQRFRDGLVSVLGPRTRRAEDQRTAHPGRDVLRHFEGRRGVLLLADPVGADDLDFHPHACGLRRRGAGRLRHRRAAGIPADVAVVLVRHRLCADDRDGDRRRRRDARAPRRLDRGVDLVHRRRRDRRDHRDLSRSLGQYLHPERRRAGREPAIFVDGRALVRLHRACKLDVFLLAR